MKAGMRKPRPRPWSHPLRRWLRDGSRLLRRVRQVSTVHGRTRHAAVGANIQRRREWSQYNLSRRSHSENTINRHAPASYRDATGRSRLGGRTASLIGPAASLVWAWRQPAGDAARTCVWRTRCRARGRDLAVGHFSAHTSTPRAGFRQRPRRGPPRASGRDAPNRGTFEPRRRRRLATTARSKAPIRVRQRSGRNSPWVDETSAGRDSIRRASGSGDCASDSRSR